MALTLTNTPPKAATKAPAKAPTRPRSNPRSARRRSRELALQGLYEWLIGGADGGLIEAHVREQEDFKGCDDEHFKQLLHGCIADAAAIDTRLSKHVDRKTQLLSPVEHAALMIGSHELQHCLDIPYRVVINEGVELAKAFGGTDGHKYVNGVLDRLAGDLRPDEVAARRSARTPSEAQG